MNQINITKIKEEFKEEFGDIWKLVLTADKTDSGCPQFERINRRVEQFLETSILKILDKIDVEEKKKPCKTYSMVDCICIDCQNIDHYNKKTKEIKDIIKTLKL